MVRQASTDDARRRGDEAVRRIREESARRIARIGRRAVASRCALGALLSLTAFAALEPRRGASPPPEVVPAAVAAPAQPDPAVARARDHLERCAKLLAGSRDLRWQLASRLGRAHGKQQRARIWAELELRHGPLARAEAAEGCPVTSLQPEERPRWEPMHGCGCAPCGHGF